MDGNLQRLFGAPGQRPDEICESGNTASLKQHRTEKIEKLSLVELGGLLAAAGRPLAQFAKYGFVRYGQLTRATRSLEIARPSNCTPGFFMTISGDYRSSSSEPAKQR